jgi:hypothetical protein
MRRGLSSGLSAQKMPPKDRKVQDEESKRYG